MQKLPPAPKEFSVPPILYRLRSGMTLWRIYSRAGTFPTTWNEFRYFGPTGSRFDHHTYPKRLQERGILYAGSGNDAIATAIAEYFQDTRIIDRRRNEPWLAAFRISKAVSLLDTTGDWPLRAGGNMAINSGSRYKAREWSRAIYRDYEEVAGIWYPSSLRNLPCLALYERAIDSIPGTPAFHEALSSPKLFAGLTVIAARLNFAMVG